MGQVCHPPRQQICQGSNDRLSGHRAVILLNHIWDGLNLVSWVAHPRHKLYPRRGESAWGEQRIWTTEVGKCKTVVLHCKCDFPDVRGLSASQLRSDYFKNRIDSWNRSECPWVSEVYLQFMQDRTGDKRNVLTLDDDIVLFILM